MRLRLLVLAAVSWAPAAAAAPAAEVVVFHAPSDAGPDVAAARDALAAATARRGAAWIDASPAPPAPPPTAGALRQAEADYDALHYDVAIASLERVAAELERTGADGLDPVALGDLFLYRGLARIQTGDARSWDDLVEAAALAPARALDPARFPPKAIEAYGRAADAARAAPRAALIVRTPDAACKVAVDAAAAPPGGKVEVAAGRHYVAVRCPGRRPWGGAVTAAGSEVVVDAAPELEAAPSDTELAIQARTAGAEAVVAITVSGTPPVAVMRRLRADGKLEDHAAAAVADRAAAAAALDRLLATPAVVAAGPERWYQRRWVWAAGGAALVAAVLVPFLILDVDDQPAGKVTVEPTGPGLP